MEGLIPLLLQAVKKQTPKNAYRCLSENSLSGRSYHLLLAGDSPEGSSHRRSCSDYVPPPLPQAVEPSENVARVKNFSGANNGLRQRVSTVQH
ncbi:Unknown protein [Striga hermonthica]|uniref:Uncharacterized protein n=1 Tax=Striga hermonthica TaxID=68872 RepID=A0A9N7RIL4_STRHE|nr:Unknown protein [Striga hermonthica]